MTKDFASIHTHTSYSQLDGASKISELVDQAKLLGMTSLGISDHGNLSGVVDFYKECKKKEIHSVLGQEFYFCDDRFLKETVKQESENGILDGSDKRYYHLSIYAENQDGFHNLIKLSSDAYLNGFFYKPRSDYAILEKHSKGLIVGSGCLGGPVLQPLLHNNYAGALAAAQRLQDAVGKDNFFIELMDHGLPEQAKTNPQLIDIATKIGAKYYCSQDTHYTKKEHAHGHSCLLCTQTGKKLSDPTRFKFHNDEYYLKSPEEMYEIFKNNPEACDTTLLIAERCNVKIDFESLHLPKFPVPEPFKTDHEFLTHLVQEGIKYRYGDPSDEVIERATYELGVFESMGVSSYMLILWDLAEFAKREKIMIGPGRGSAAGSLVSYVLGVTKVDPIKYDLIFERFLNPSRIALPDVDWDIEQRYRDKLINYTIEKYGKEYVAQIITFGTIKARTAVRDAARVLDYPPSLGDKLAKLMPPLVSGFDTPLWACLEYNEKYEAGYQNAQGLREVYNSDPSAKEVVDTALSLEGLQKSQGIHAAGVVIGDRPLDEIVPIFKNKDGLVATQWDKKIVEAIGLNKMDYLVLKNLDIISDACSLIGDNFDIENIPEDDFETFQMLCTGNTIGCFQIESTGMRQLLRRLEPNSIYDISAVLALYRPGPMAQNMHNDYADRKNHRKIVTTFHKDAEESLSVTYGLFIYQEQIMSLSVQFADYSLTEADNLRKIIGKKIPDEMKAEKGKFVQGCINNGYGEDLGNKLFDMIDSWSAYGFNKSHSISYALITYWTAYLKTHYPRQYMAALGTHSMYGSDAADTTARYLGEARRMGLKVYPPDLNSSELEYTVAPDGIRIGLGTLRNLGEGSTAELVRIRKEKEFASLYDFARRVNPKAPAFKSLAYAGALDSFGTRLGISSVVSDILTQARKDAKKGEQESLFDIEDLSGIEIPDTEFQWAELLAKEKEVMSIYASGHPLEDYTEYSTKENLMDVQESSIGSTHKTLVIISDIKRKYTKNNQLMAILTVEDQTGALEVVAFPKSWEGWDSVIHPGSIVKIGIRCGTDYNDEKNYVLSFIEEIKTKSLEISNSRIGFYLPKGLHNKPKYVSKLKGILLQNYGNVPVDIYISRSTTLKLENEYNVDGSEKLLSELKSLFQRYREGVD